MIAGRLNKKIVIEHNRRTEANSLGEEERTGMRNLPTRADVVWNSGGRKVDLEVDYPEDVTFIVWIHLYSRIKEGDTVVYAGKRYRINAMQPVPETKTLYLKAELL